MRVTGTLSLEGGDAAADTSGSCVSGVGVFPHRSGRKPAPAPVTAAKSLIFKAVGALIFGTNVAVTSGSMLSVRLRSVCRFLAPLFLLGLASPGAHAQQPGKDGPLTVAASNTVLNKYAVLSANASAGATSIDVTNPGGADGLDPATLTLNDLLLVIQMQGATMDTSQGKNEL